MRVDQGRADLSWSAVVRIPPQRWGRPLLCAHVGPVIDERPALGTDALRGNRHGRSSVEAHPASLERVTSLGTSYRCSATPSLVLVNACMWANAS